MSDATHRSIEPLVLKVLVAAFTIFIIGYILVPILVTLVMSFNNAAMIRLVGALVRGLFRQRSVDRCAEEQHSDRSRNRRHIHHGGCAVRLGVPALPHSVP
jgi:hypothetical protein